MAQYTEITASSQLSITNNIDTFRLAVVSGQLAIQKQIGESSWSTIDLYTASGLGVFRVGTRDEHWVIDETLDATGFSGTEDISWKNVEKHKLF